MFKKVISVISAVVMLSASLVGCSKTEDVASGGIPKVYIYMNNGAASDSTSNPADLEKIKQKIIEEAGIEPVILSGSAGAEAEKLNVVLASGQELDIFWGEWSDYSGKNMITPINDLLEKHGKNILAQLSEDMWTGAKDNEGNIWGIPRTSATMGYPVFVRSDWLEKYGLEAPTTVAELENVMKVFKENDPAGNNTTIPVVIQTAGMEKGLSAAFTGKGYGNYLDEDGKVKPSVLHPGYKTLVETMARWYKNGYINKEGFTMDTARIREYIKQGKVGIHMEWYSNVTLFTPDMQLNNPDADYVMTVIKENGVNAQSHLSPSQKSLLITKRSKNAENAMKLIDWAYSSLENYNILAYGLEGEHFNYVDEARTEVEIVNPDKKVYCGDFNFALGVMENKALEERKDRNMHQEYIVNNLYNYENATKVFDYGVVYDSDVLAEQIPMMSDIERMVDEELIKFITGTKDMSQWDAFIEGLYGIGLDTYIDVYTEQYNANKK